MGGSSKSPASASPAATPTPQQPMQTIQPAMPGQLEALAQQLGAGFGQSAPDMLSYLQQFYKPMQMADYSKGFVPPTGSAATPAPTQSGGSTSRPSNRLSPEEIFKRTSR